MHAELDAKMAAAYPDHASNQDFPPIVFDSITIDPATTLSTSDRAALVDRIRSSSERAAPGWLDELEGVYVAGYFKDRGYFVADASVTSQTLKTDSDGIHVAVTVVTKQGAQYRMGKVSFRPADPDQPLFFSEIQLEQHFYLKDGDVFAASSIRRTLDELKTLYGSHGFIDFVATPITDVREDTRKIDLTFELDEQRQFHLGDVTVDTASDQALSSIRAAFAPGSVFNAELVTKVLNDNASTLPSDVSLDDIEMHRHVKAGTVDIAFHLAPCPTIQH